MSEAEPTIAEMLTAVNVAIMTIAVKGQSYTIGDVRYDRANLSALKELKKELLQQVRAGSGSIRLGDFGG